MNLTERQDKERKALIGEIIEEAEKKSIASLLRLKSLAKALKSVTADPETYFINIDKEE